MVMKGCEPDPGTLQSLKEVPMKELMTLKKQAF
jgi:hypothetical protein